MAGVVFSVRIPAPLVAEMKAAAKLQGMSVSAWVARSCKHVADLEASGEKLAVKESPPPVRVVLPPRPVERKPFAPDFRPGSKR